jgi:hypothetical protein
MSGSARGDPPGLVDRLGVRDTLDDEALGGLEERDQERVHDVARLLFVDLDMVVLRVFLSPAGFLANTRHPTQDLC